MQFRYYLDSVDELISYYDSVSDPPVYVKMTPKLFNKWSEWAKSYKPKEDNAIKEFGTRIGPDWEKTEFNDLEDFYIFFTEIIEGD